MWPPAAVPALAVVIGAAGGAVLGPPPTVVGTGAALAWTVWLVAASWRPPRSSWLPASAGRNRVRLTVSAPACLLAGAALASHARATALDTPLRSLLDAPAPGFALTASEPPADLHPLQARIVLLEDATAGEALTTLRARATAVRFDGTWRATEGGLIVSVAGAQASRVGEAWTAGRTLELPLTFRRPSRFLNDGVPDFEAGLALDGVTLFASTKSGLLVTVVQQGSALEELAARVRAHVRSASGAWIGVHARLSASIVTAVLIGDRSGLPVEIRERLQVAGTYHVIAISGGNIAILVALSLGLLRLAGIAGRPAAAASLFILLAYANVVTAGPSVWRATVMGSLYLAARALDHRTSPWNALAVTALLIVCVHPLDVRDVGFVLTFGATVALLDVARRANDWTRSRVAAWLLGSIAASLATEAALLPVSASVFSRVTSAGLILNLVAVPLMALVQVLGMVVALCDALPFIAAPAGWAAHGAARGLVDSAALVDAAPWLSVRVPPPSLSLIVIYYAALAGSLFGRPWLRALAIGIWILTAGAMGGIITWPSSARWAGDDLRLTVFDVGQSEALLLESRGGRLMIDAGGVPFGSATFDIGGRVLTPALWARGVRHLDALLLTHGDPDHIGGAASVISDFRPRTLLEGIRVPTHAPSNEVRARATRHHAVAAPVNRHAAFTLGAVRIRVLHPPEPDWERARVRNDDSVVLEVVQGDVAILLTGDVGAAVERELAPLLPPARVRILKVAHHGSRTSTSRALLDAWRPQIALISAGRGNTFGHPAPEVLARLEAAGARVYRTDRDGQITVTSNGRDVQVTTFTGERR